MKKYIIMILSSVIFAQYSIAATHTVNDLNKIEDSIFGFQYNNESTNTRLSRIEQSVYGKTYPAKSEKERISKLNKDISVDSIGKEIIPVEDTFAESPEYISDEITETSDVSYPVIDEMEQKVFKQVNKLDKIQARLTKLEQKTFNRTYNDDLNTRVERLRAKIKPDSLLENKIAQSSNIFYDDEVDKLATEYHLDKYVPPGSFDYEMYNDMNNRFNTAEKYYNNNKPQKISLSSIEKFLYHQTYNNEPTEHRLSRIENSMFGSEFSSDDIETRLNRISSAYKAEKSAGRYDSNKFAQNMATAMQIGTILLMVLACIL